MNLQFIVTKNQLINIVLRFVQPFAELIIKMLAGLTKWV